MSRCSTTLTKRRPRSHPLGWLALLYLFAWLTAPAQAAMPRVQVADDASGFILTTGERFVPWGFNYDHDRDNRLIEDYWEAEWETVVDDFHEMKAMGANVVRIHLQFGRFMKTAEEPCERALEKLDDLVRLAEEVGIYLNLTGLGCYIKPNVPDWYDALDELGRWAAQAHFWEAIAARCAASPAIFCYDLMNEPVVPGRGRRDDWLGPAFGDRHFVQFITLELGERERPDVARQWVAQLVSAIRRHDDRTMITVGLVPWSLNRPGLTSGFEPQRIVDQLDFISMHIYPKRGELEESLETVRGFDVGKPIVIEEIFPLNCSAAELGTFIERSREDAHGWIGFYWGKTPEELRAGGTIGDAMMLGWLELFQKMQPGD